MSRPSPCRRGMSIHERARTDGPGRADRSVQRRAAEGLLYRRVAVERLPMRRAGFRRSVAGLEGAVAGARRRAQTIGCGLTREGAGGRVGGRMGFCARTGPSVESPTPQDQQPTVESPTPQDPATKHRSRERLGITLAIAACHLQVSIGRLASASTNQADQR
jgi:hypothetical protein